MKTAKELVSCILFVLLTIVFHINSATAGVVGCSGQAALLAQPSGDEIRVSTSYTLRNFNDTKTIRIDRILVYDADGVLHCDFPTVDAFPAALKTNLLPHQSTRLGTVNMASCQNPVVPAAEGTLQTIIQWSFVGGGKGQDLLVTSLGIFLNPTLGTILDNVPFKCDSVDPR